jgi:hypothetical protein
VFAKRTHSSKPLLLARCQGSNLDTNSLNDGSLDESLGKIEWGALHKFLLYLNDKRGSSKKNQIFTASTSVHLYTYASILVF